MSKKEFISFRFNAVDWRASHLSEGCILIEAIEKPEISKVHASAEHMVSLLETDLIDIVPAYDSIALFSTSRMEEITDLLSKATVKERGESTSSAHIEVPICYELGLDLEDIAEQSNMEIQKVIDLHQEGTYRAILIGFTPGFIYMDGLDSRIACPRRANPRKQIASGSIGIGGDQTGIYSLDSPGGWNIIGRTPIKLFDDSQQPPMKVNVGSKVTFSRITLEEFESWES